MPRYTDLVSTLPASVPFVGPEARERELGRPFTARLGANESVFGPSPKAVEAMISATADVWKYGDSESWDLREALAAHHAVAPENLMVGEGIDSLLGTLVRLIVSPGTPVVTSLGAYPTFNFHVAGFGGVLHQVPYRNDGADPLALANRARESNASLVYLANPDNPMGGWIPASDIETLLAALPENCLLCLDEAYNDFAPAEAIPSIDVTDTRLIRMRTFSKAHGMAGARIGYAIAHSGLISAFNKVRNHFGVNRIAQEGALAALQDTDWLAHVVAEVSRGRERLNAIAAEQGLRALPSATNFVTIDCGRDGDFARRVLGALVEDGIFVRMPYVAPQDRCIRVGIGRLTDSDAFHRSFPKALAAARG